MDDTQRGLYAKYRVERIEDPAKKHDDCDYFVLDLDHDPFARVALTAYIDACRNTYPQLAKDLQHLLDVLNSRVSPDGVTPNG